MIDGSTRRFARGDHVHEAPLAVTDEPQSPDLDRWLDRHGEELIRASLAVIVERSTLAELSARPLGDWIAELRARLGPGGGPRHGSEVAQPEPSAEEAAPDERPEAEEPVESRGESDPEASTPPPRAPSRPRSGELAAALGLLAADSHPRGAESFASAVEHRRRLEHEVAHRLREQRPSQRPFSIALLHPGERSAESGAPAAPPEGWTEAVRGAAEDEAAVFDAGFGVTAVLLPRSGPLGARATLDAVRVAAWRRLGERGALPDAGLATFPDDGATAETLVAAALERLGRHTDATISAPDED